MQQPFQRCSNQWSAPTSNKDMLSGHHTRKETVRKYRKIQRRAAKLVPTLKDKPYEDRLEARNLPSLHHRRQRGDMIQVYKINQ